MRIRVIKLNYRLTIASLVLMIMIITIATLTSVRASEPMEEEKGIRIPIIMYHSILKSRTGKYIVSPAQLEEDLRYIKEKGYETIVMADLIAYVHEGRELPEKPIILTFDDGFYNNAHYLIPLLEKYNMRAVISVVGKYTDDFSEANDMNINYAHFRWEDIKRLIPEGVVEFQNHSYNLHRIENGQKGARRKRGESVEDYGKRLEADLLKLQRLFKENTGFTPTTFTFPYGAYSKESTEILRELGFKASLICESGVNYITRDENSLFSLKRFNRSGGTTTERFFKGILE
ncbi:MAG: polysaccharide deacetylase family protein [Oscillospiraceae bacterium]|nr:polysaccharide deacetylase family protein [Oscillospiraceae bacterium]